jgi:CheY-like chemotaxis protein
VPFAAAQPRPWILVADDDVRVRELWLHVLTRAGYRVVAASDGRQTLELARAVVPDLLVLDLKMPGVSGHGVLAALQATPIVPRLPVLIVSGFLDDPGAGAELGLTIVGRLAKPLPLNALLEAVRVALARRPA